MSNPTAALQRATMFNALCRANHLPEPHHEFRFHATRKWRFDFCWPEPHMLAVELQGAIFSGGRHVRGAALVKEYEKLNAAAILGYRVMFVTTKQLEDGSVFDLIRAALA